MIKKLKYFIQAIIIYIFFIIGKLLGKTISRKVFSFLFFKFVPFFKSKKIIEKNLRIFKNNISVDEINSITLEFLKNYGMTFIEYIFLNDFRKDNSHMTIKGKENLLKILQQNKSVIFVSGHFANYELMSMEINKMNIKLATIYRPLNNFFLNPLMEYLRRKYVCKYQIKKGIKGVREAIDFINKDFSIALMIDQRVSEGEKINFFNKSALTTTLPAQLSIKYNLPIIPVFIERINTNKFQLIFHSQIKPDNYNNKLSLTKKLNEILEQMISKNPNQWIWTHNRWK